MPLNICKLSRLQVLNIATNKLQNLPDDFGNLVNLRSLNVLENKKLQQLPKSLCRAQQLTDIILDNEQFLYPPSEIVKEGAKSILLYICEGILLNYCKQLNITH